MSKQALQFIPVDIYTCTARSKRIHTQSGALERSRTRESVVVIDIKHLTEVCKHDTENTSVDTECWGEEAFYVSHCHIADACILDIWHEMGGEGSDQDIIWNMKYLVLSSPNSCANTKIKL